MNFKELLEGAEPKMPGAPSGIQIMTPQQFVAKAGDMPGEKEVDEGVRDLGYDAQSLIMKLRRDVEERRLQPTREAILAAARELAGDMDFAPELLVQQVLGKMLGEKELDEDVLDEGVLNKIGSMALGLALAFGATHSMAEQMYVYQDAGTQKLRIAPSLDKVPTDALMSFKVDTDSKTVDIIKGNQVRPVQVDPATVKQAQQQAGGQAAQQTTQQTQPAKIQSPQQTKVSPGVIFKNDKWTAEFSKNAMTDKSSCTIFSKDNRHVQVNVNADGSGSIYDSFRGRGGVRSYQYRIDNDAPSKTLYLSGALKEISLIELPLSAIQNRSKLTIQTFTILSDVVTDSIDLSSLQPAISACQQAMNQVNENIIKFGEDHLNRIRSLSGLSEATKLPASSREFGGDEFQDYMKRIVGTPDLDKEGNVKKDKKGNEKYVSGKTKTDRYKMPYIHRSSVVEYVGPDGQTYSEDKIKQALVQRPKALLKQNEKMKHSNGDLEQFFNVGFAALTGIALDEDTNKLIIVNTCPGAGSCKVDCFAMKGGKVQFKAAWLSDGRILTYLLNDPDGFFSQLSSEIAKEEKLGQKGGYTVTIRWHDAGDFFSPEYLDLALKMAAKHPDTKFYAYTKMAGAALGQKPPNFIINWSEGANTGQEKQVKAKDANLDTTKNSRIVPDELFQDLLVKDEKKNLVKGSSGQWQVQPNKLPELKNRLAKEYGLSANSILNYDEYMAKRKSIPAGMKYNVIVAPGEGDISANDPNIISTLLLKH